MQKMIDELIAAIFGVSQDKAHFNSVADAVREVERLHRLARSFKRLIGQDASSKRYVLIGGNPFRGYTGTQTYTSLRVVDSFETEAEANQGWKQHYEDCGGLMLILDTHTGGEIIPS